MIIESKETKEKLLSGLNKTANVVKSTLGAKGRTVMVVDNLKLSFNVTKDGVTVAKNVVLEDEIENYGCVFIKNAAIKTVEEAGDGTTTTTILTQALCNELENQIERGANPYELQEELKEDLIKIKKYIKDNSKTVDNLEQIRQIATISSNNDESIGEIFEKIYSEIGMQGAVTVIETDNTETSYKIVDGYSLSNTGYGHNMFVNNYDKGTVEYENPNIYVFNNKISNFNSLVPILNKTVNPLDENFKPTVIICHDIEEAPLKLILEALASGKIKELTIVISNLIAQDRKNRFLDVCSVIDSEYGEDNFGEPGTCERVIIEKENIVFINGKGNKEGYLKKLKKIKNPDRDLTDRIFRLESKAAMIGVGGKVPQEISETKDRIDDSILSVKSSIEEGYCAGGATTYLFAIKDLDLQSEALKKSLEAPYIQLLENANVRPNKILKEIYKLGYGYGYDVKNDNLAQLYDKGIIDSSKVLRVSVENAVHTASNFMFINSIVLP